MRDQRFGWGGFSARGFSRQWPQVHSHTPGIVFDRISETTKDILKDVISKGRKETTVLCHCFSSFSAEWPAIVAVMGVDVAGKKEYDLMRLYLMASRARVRCSILIVPEEGLLLDEYPFILDLFKKLEPHSHVMYHSKDLAAK